MADTEPLFLAFWGDIRLFVSSMQWQGGQTQVVHNLASGDIHPVQPRGAQIRTSRLQLLFDDFDGASETGVVALRRFEQSIAERRLFTHPVDGTYFARIGDFEPQIDDSSVVTAMCEFIPDGDVQLISPTGGGMTIAAGEGAVAQAADKLNTDLADLGIGFQPEAIKRLDFNKSISLNIDASFSVTASVALSANLSASASADASVSASVSANAQLQASASVLAFADVYAAAAAAAQVTAVAQISGMGSASAFAFAYASAALDADARASVAAWSEEDAPARRASVDAARIRESISTLIDTGELETNLQLWPAYRSAIMLGDAVHSAAVAASSETANLFTMLVQSPTALLPLAARIYGGAAAQDRARQIAALNDIKTVGWLDPGSYLMPARPPGSQPVFGTA